MTLRLFARFLLTSLAIVAVSDAAQAEIFPTRRITLVAPFPAGSGADLAARYIAAGLARGFRQDVVVENVPGVDGVLAAQQVARAPADGYTLLVGTNSTHAANRQLHAPLPYDPLADFKPIASILRSPMALLSRPEPTLAGVRDLVARARWEPEKLGLGFGNTSGRAAAELFMATSGARFNRVPYRGTPGAITDLLGGRIDAAFVDLAVAGDHVRAGSLKALAVTSQARVAAYPDVPTFVEAGYPGIEIVSWVVAFAPARTPQDIVDALRLRIDAIVASPEAAALLAKTGAEPFRIGPDELPTFLGAEAAKWPQLLRSHGVVEDR